MTGDHRSSEYFVEMIQFCVGGNDAEYIFDVAAAVFFIVNVEQKQCVIPLIFRRCPRLCFLAFHLFSVIIYI